ncbi:metal ABC transporter solute-binding protein, Zn/Mn family [Modestobacter marinus]|uniref:metal ABC transporter solute-binding protein, Zn/Mn family n=1 Tax=Modestobacter marinus TaxID=477641 RepID=UPI001C98A3FB|nr:zinc ABC transporter substrate-binding protein [Modestobacter marinus]
MRSPLRRAALLAASSLALVATAACGSGEDAGADDGVRAVASTDVYGDVVAAIGGDRVEVTSVLDDPSADPHSFEANTRTQLAVSRADLVVANGGGYDDFMQTLVAADGSGAVVLDAVEVSGLDAEAEGFNEHVWYDLAAMDALAEEVVTALGEIDPAGAGDYEANGAQFRAGLQELIAAGEQARATTQGAGVAVTEPVPGHLLDALGAEDLTPAEFAEAVEEGGDVSPAVLQETLDLIGSGQVRALVYNDQTSGPETERLLEAARAAGVDVVPVTETLPEGQDYLSWMRGNLDAVVAALSA